MPAKGRQGVRLDGKFDELERLIASDPQPVEGGVPLADPELVIVFEVILETADLADAFARAGLVMTLIGVSPVLLIESPHP